MRIVSGNLKYRKIEVPAEVRPTTEKVREAIFSIIGDKILNAKVLDLFAGSGSLGIEAKSRGAEKVVFNELLRKNLKILKKNLCNCKIEDKVILSTVDFRNFLEKSKEKFDIVFLDPPYNSGYYDLSIEMISEMHLLNKNGIIIAEHLYCDPLQDSYGQIKKIKTKKYGTIGVDIYQMIEKLQ